jgi:hypothetical protein
MNKKAARETSLLLMQVGHKLAKHLAKIQEHCSEKEFARIAHGIGHVFDTLYAEVEAPIYVEYPDLKPRELGGPSKPKRRPTRRSSRR